MMMHSQLLGGPAVPGPSGLLPQSSNSLQDGALNQQFSQPKEELKTQFSTREGVYRVMPLAEYSRPTRVPMNQMTPGAPNQSGAPVRVSFLNMNAPISPSRRRDMSEDDIDDASSSDRICFNVGRELYVYAYRGTQTAADLSKPIDKRVYKGTFPTCHHFNQEMVTPTKCSLLIGFSAGQIQLIDPHNKEYQASRLYNEERLIDKTAVTCLKWVPGQPQHFLVSYASGCIFLYSEELQCPQVAPTYQTFKSGDKFTVSTCKAKTSRNPMYRWQVGEGAVHQFAFSGPDAKLLATVGHDGYLRIFNYHQMELLSFMKSYFGGLLTLAWSPDAKLIVTGGEDDLLTVYHVHEKRLVCRGQGHKSWISQVAFDPFVCGEEPGTAGAEAGDMGGLLLDACSEDDIRTSNETSLTRGGGMRRQPMTTSAYSRCSFASFGTINGFSHTGRSGICYRIGSVGHDTQLCLWDITEDMLKPANVQRHRNSTIIAPMANLEIQTSTCGRLDPLSEASPATSSSSEKPKKKRFHRRGFTLGRLSGGGSSDRRRVDGGGATQTGPTTLDESKLLGTKFCPRIEDMPVIEPLICKKVAHERLTVIEFRRDCLVTACQEGFICTWARPGLGPQGNCRRSTSLSPAATSPNTREREKLEYGGCDFVSSSVGTPSRAVNPSSSSYWAHHQPVQG